MTDIYEPAPGAGRSLVPAPQANRWNLQRRQTFLAELANSANVSLAARKAGMRPQAAYQLRRRDPEFARSWREALDDGYSELELQLLHLARNGVEQVERIEEGEEGKVRFVRTTHSFPMAVAVRLLQAHRAEVMAIRREQAPAQPGQHETRRSQLKRAREYIVSLRTRLLPGESAEQGDEVDGR